MNETDVLIIGGGAIGISSAHFLLDAGREVTVIEKGEVCSGSSYGNAGLVVPSHSVPLAAPGVVSKGLRWMLNPESPFYIKPRLDWELISWLWQFRKHCRRSHVTRSAPVIRDLHLKSVDLFEELAKVDGLDFGFEQRGILYTFNTSRGFEEGQEEAEFQKELGIECTVMSPAEVKEVEPSLREDLAGGLFYPQDAHLIPDRYVRGLANHVSERGADIRTNTEVLGFEVTAGRIEKVKTTRGDFRAREVVLAGGSWSPGLGGELRLRLPIQPAKGYSITVQRPEKGPHLPAIMVEAKVAVTPMSESLRFAGTLELAGLDLTINKRRVNAILKAIPEYFSEFGPDELQLEEIWRGLRPCTPDGLPFLGRSPGLENLTVAAGHAMIGISLAPVTGKLVSQLVTGEAPLLDLEPLAVNRFA